MNASTQNTINFLSKLTVRRVWNMSLVYLSFYLTKYFKKPIQYGKPFSISFEPTTSCNLRCPECPSGLRAFTRPIGMLVPAFF
ncbi:MAG TPA: radical SAM protein, partial [Chitinophagales bacterium]|nr:radical SAM protein [Chitinophagales bacterium]